MFAELLPTKDQEADARRAELLEAAVEWWKRPAYQREGLDRVVPLLAQQIDTGRAEGRRLSHVLADALERKGFPNHYPDARFACARFADDHDGDLELLVVSWFAANPTPRPEAIPPR